MWHSNKSSILSLAAFGSCSVFIRSLIVTSAFEFVISLILLLR